MFKKNNTVALKGGSYSLIISAVVLAILVVVNIMASVLPANITKLDISSSKLYSITSNTKVVVNSLEKDVTIYWIVQADKEDSVIENLLEKYDSLSSHISVVKKNPDVFPTFAAQYTDETVSNNSFVVECGDKYRYIPYADIYPSDIDYTTYSQTYSFDGEGAITSAIGYVVSEDLPKVYLTEGHGEQDLASGFADQVEKANIETETFSLLNVDEIPEDCDSIIINAPTSDISEEEKTMLSDYMANGGKVLVFSGTSEDPETQLTNLNSLLEDYGVSVTNGVVVEEDRDHYALQMPYVLLPDIQNTDITSSLIDGSYYILVPISNGLVVSGSTSNGTVTSLLDTTDTAFCKVDGYNLSTYDKEENDVDGPFSLAVSIETNGGGQMIWVASSYLIDESYNAYSSGANVNFAMNALSSLVGETESLEIRSKSLSYNYLTITESQGTTLKTVMIGVIPAIFVVAGIIVIVQRRQKKNEQV